MVETRRYTIAPFPKKAKYWSDVASYTGGGNEISISTNAANNVIEIPLNEYMPNSYSDGVYVILTTVKLYFYYTSTPSGQLHILGQNPFRVNSYADSAIYDLSTTSWTTEGTNTYSISLNPNLVVTEGYGYEIYIYNLTNSSALDFQGGYVELTSAVEPDAQDLVSATTPNDSMIRLTRNATYPNGNGSTVTSWSVWRSASSGGTYNSIASGLTATTYDDWSVNGGETWYYKAKFTNSIGDSVLSTNSVSTTAITPEITKTSDTRILDTFSFTKTSDSAIHQPGWDTITNLSDVLIKVIDNQIDILSDTRIKVIDNEITKSSDKRIIRSMKPLSDVPSTNLLVYLPLQEDFYDYSGNGRSVTYTQGIEFLEGSESYNAAFTHEDGTYLEYIAINNTDQALHAEDGDELSFSFSFYRDDSYTDKEGALIASSFNSSGGYNYVLYFNTDDTLSLKIGGQLFSDTIISYSAPYTLNAYEWYNIVVTIDNINDVAICYLNGTKIIDIDTSSILWTQTTDNTAPITIGTYYPYGHTTSSVGRGTHICGGGYQKFALWNRILSDEEIKQLSTSTLLTGSSAIYQPASSDPISGTLGVDYFGHYDILADSRIKNTYSNTPLSDSSIMKIGEISRISDTNIHKTDLSFILLSNSAIFRTAFDIKSLLSDSIIKRDGYNDIQVQSFCKILCEYKNILSSDSAIYNAAYGNIQTISDSRIVQFGTYVLNPVYSNSDISKTTELTAISDTYIILNYTNDLLSDTAIHRLNYNSNDILSDSAIFVDSFNDINKLSNTAIFLSGLSIIKSSDSRIKREAGYLYPLQQKLINSDTIIKTLDKQIDINTSSRIKTIPNEVSNTSDSLIIHINSITKSTDSSISISTIKDILIYSRIKNSFTNDTVSNSAIKRFNYNINTLLSDTVIHREPILNITSDTRIVELFEMTGIQSDTHIFASGLDKSIFSDSAIFRSEYGYIFKKCLVSIKQVGQKITVYSQEIIRRSPILTITSDTAIRRDNGYIKVLFEKGRQL